MAPAAPTSEFFPRVEGHLADDEIPSFDDVLAERRRFEERRRQAEETAAASTED